MADLTPKREWENGVLGGTPLEKIPLNALEMDLIVSLVQLARAPELLFAGAVTPDAGGAPVSAVIQWPDGMSGVYSGTASPTFPGAVDGYTITRTGAPVRTFTQPAVTRDASGTVTNRPPIVIS